LIQPPILIIDGYDIKIYDSLEEAHKNLEPEDFASHRLKVYDATGQELKVELPEQTHESKVLGLFSRQETTHEILLGEHDPPLKPVDELRKLLVAWLNLYSQLEEHTLEGWSLEDMIAAVLADQQES
jgi:hypothetical protein